MPKLKNLPKRSNIKTALLALSFCALLIFSAKTFKFLYSLDQPTTPNLVEGHISPLTSDYSYNVALIARDLAVINIDPVNKKVTALRIPENTFVDIPKGFGSWPILNAYKIGQAENPKIGTNLVSLSLQKLLGLPIDRIIVINQNKKRPPSSEELIKTWSGNPLISYLTIPTHETNFSPKEKLSFFSALSTTRADKLKFLDLYQTNITQSKLLPDSSRVLGVNKIKLDLFLRDEMFDSKIFSETIPIAIYNATEIPNLASDLARIITNLGGSVIITSNSDQKTNNSLISSSQDVKNSATFRRLAYLISPNCIGNKCKFDDTNVDRSRAKITIVLGNDYYLANY